MQHRTIESKQRAQMCTELNYPVYNILKSFSILGLKKKKKSLSVSPVFLFDNGFKFKMSFEYIFIISTT